VRPTCRRTVTDVLHHALSASLYSTDPIPGLCATYTLTKTIETALNDDMWTENCVDGVHCGGLKVTWPSLEPRLRHSCGGVRWVWSTNRHTLHTHGCSHVQSLTRDEQISSLQNWHSSFLLFLSTWMVILKCSWCRIQSSAPS